MLTEAEVARRRELQRRAYAVRAEATEAELAELRELDARAAVPVSDPVVPVQNQAQTALTEPAAVEPAPSGSMLSRRELSEPAAPDPVSDSAPVSAGEVADEPSTTGSAPDETSGGASAARRRTGIPVLVLSTLVALLLGFGGGWMLLNRADAPAMTAAQAGAMAEIEKTARFDPGSVVYLGEKYGASVWRATSEDGEKICVAMHVVDKNEYACIPPSDGDNPFTQPVGVSLDRVDGDALWSYWATLVPDITGREVLIIQRHDMSAGFDWKTQFTTDELALIERLEARGVEPQYLQIIGYDGDVPVFFSQGERTCVYVVIPAGDLITETCEAVDRVYSLSVGDTTYEVRQSDSRGPMLTVVRAAG